MRYPGIVSYLDFAVWSVARLRVFGVFRLHIAHRCRIFHFPSAGDVVGVAESGRYVPQFALYASAGPLKVVGSGTCRESCKERRVGRAGVLEVETRSESHIAQLQSLVLCGVSPPRIYYGGFYRKTLRQWHLYRHIHHCEQVVEQIGLDEKNRA